MESHIHHDFIVYRHYGVQMLDRTCGCESATDIRTRIMKDGTQVVTYDDCHTEVTTGGRLHDPQGGWAVLCFKLYHSKYRACWNNGVQEWYSFTITGECYHHPTIPALQLKWYWMNKEVTEEEHIQIRQRVIRQMRWLKTRRFLRLCKSRAFVETFYSPESMGGRWAKQQLNKVCKRKLTCH